MSSSKLDQSLDSIIKSSQKAKKPAAAKSNKSGKPNSASQKGNKPASQKANSNKGNGPVRKDRQRARNAAAPYNNGSGRKSNLVNNAAFALAPAPFNPAAFAQLAQLQAQTQAAQAQLEAAKAEAARQQKLAAQAAKRQENDQKREEKQKEKESRKVVGNQVLVSNLAQDVNATDLKEIFDKIGAISDVSINYNEQGKSKGTAQVTFKANSDAERAVAEYDGAEIDGRPMYLKLIGSIAAPKVVKKSKKAVKKVAPAAPAPIAPVAPLANPLLNPALLLDPALLAAAGMQMGGRPNRPASAGSQKAQKRPNSASQKGSASKGNNAASNKGDKKAKNGNAASKKGKTNGAASNKAPKKEKNDKKPVSAAALDAELENYHSTAAKE